VVQPATAQPTLVAGAMNGQPAVQFDGASYLQSAVVDLAAGADDLSVIAVLQPDATQVGWATMLGYGFPIYQQGGFGILQGWSEANHIGLLWSAANNAGGYPNGLNARLMMTVGTAQVVEYVKSGTMQQAFLNGVQLGTDTVPATLGAPVTQLGVGALPGGFNGYQGQIAEILIYNRALTATERQSIEQQLTLKYGLPSAPPLVTLTGPASGGVYAATATVTLTATASAPAGTLTSVEFFNGTTKLGDGTAVTGQPGSYQLVLPAGTTAGTYVLTAKATDSNGNTATSGAATITINPPPPTAVVASGLRAWYRADTSVLRDANNKVSQWTDL